MLATQLLLKYACLWRFTNLLVFYFFILSLQVRINEMNCFTGLGNVEWGWDYIIWNNVKFFEECMAEETCHNLFNNSKLLN